MMRTRLHVTVMYHRYIGQVIELTTVVLCISFKVNNTRATHNRAFKLCQPKIIKILNTPGNRKAALICRLGFSPAAS